MQIVKVNTSKIYDIIIDKGILNSIGKYINDISSCKKILIVTDDNVKSLYLDEVRSSLNDKDIYTFSFAPGEKSKSIETITKIENILIDNLFSRNDLIISLGGGVCSDLSGFAASIYKRGIQYVNIPTTLLSMVDASIGGKTSINTDKCKNIIGTFYQPSLVIIDPNTLKTLDKEIYNEGVGEIIKYALISNNKLIDYLIDGIDKNIEDTIIECVEIKSKLIESDEFDNNDRMILNFGHSFAHSIESLSNYTIPHGKAVAIGIIKLLDSLSQNEMISTNILKKVKEICDKYDINYSCDYSSDKLIDLIKYDKKTKSDTIKEILINDIGQPQIKEFTFKEYEELFK